MSAGGAARALIEVLGSPVARDLVREAVCEGCGLGAHGLAQAPLAGPHLCAPGWRAALLHALPPLAPVDVADIARLRALDAGRLAALGRLDVAYELRPGARGLRALPVEEAVREAAASLRSTPLEGRAWLAAPAGASHDAWRALASAAEVAGGPAAEVLASPVDAELIAAFAQPAAPPIAPLEAILGAELVWVWGARLARDYPALLPALAQARRAGAQVVLLDPQPDPALARARVPGSLADTVLGAALVDAWVPLRPGGDAALAAALVRRIAGPGASPEPGPHGSLGVVELAERAGVRLGQLEWLSAVLGPARRVVSLLGPGLVRSPGGLAAVRGLHAALGATHGPGAGLYPLWTAAAVNGAPAAGLRPRPSGAELPAWSFVLGCSDTQPWRWGPGRVRVHLATHLSPEMLVEAEERVIVLPALGRHAQPEGALVVGWDGVVRHSPQRLQDPSEALLARELPRSLAEAAEPSLRATPWARGLPALRDALRRDPPGQRVSPAVRRGRAWRWPPALEPAEDAIAVEEPLEIRVEGEPLAVLLRTPGHDLDLAVGFLLTEGVIGGLDDLAALAPLAGPRAANTVDCRLAEGVIAHRERLDTARRALYATSACGVCGKASIDRLRLQAPPVPPSSLAAERAARLGAMLAEHQPGFRATGGLHGAALFGDALAPERVAEDVGRHNAVDKVLGASLRGGARLGEAHCLVVSSRAGFEIVQKAWMAGVPAVVAVGAPTSLAVEVAEEAGIRLFGFARGDRVSRYA